MIDLSGVEHMSGSCVRHIALASLLHVAGRTTQALPESGMTTVLHPPGYGASFKFFLVLLKSTSAIRIR